MSEDNLALVISSDPAFQKTYINKTKDPSWQIPTNYETELKDYYSAPITLIGTISGPDDYKTLVEAQSLLKVHKERVAVVVHHLRALQYRWEKLYRKALRYIEISHYRELSTVKDSIRKSVLSAALEPIEEGVKELNYLVEMANMVKSHLDDIGWAVKHSGDLVNNYFSTVRNLNPLREV